MASVNNMLLFCSRCLEYIRCCGVTVHTCPTLKHLSGFLDSFSTEEVIIPQVTGPNTPTLFFHTQPGCSFPHTFPLRFILLTIYCCHYSANNNSWKKTTSLKIRHWPCLSPGEQMTDSYAGKHTPEFVRCENDPALQEQRGEHPEEETQAQRGEEAFKVDMFQPGI